MQSTLWVPVDIYTCPKCHKQCLDRQHEACKGATPKFRLVEEQSSEAEKMLLQEAGEPLEIKLGVHFYVLSVKWFRLWQQYVIR